LCNVILGQKFPAMWLSASIFFAIIHSNLAVASPALEHRNVGFAADPSINAGGIFNAARNAKSFVAKFPDGHGTNVNIFDDWLNIEGVKAFGFIADMDVDCDGVDVSSRFIMKICMFSNPFQ
jgi:hypothetical protein